jgi:prepilin-type N-terminal cleavage/methylation domain-containing protein/prepilin-type processing-associated H-X9-DG protein
MRAVRMKPRAPGGARRRGFTLIELLVVISILTMLAALLFPVLARARAAGWRASCLSNLRQIAIAHQLYLQDYDEQFPDWWRMASRSQAIYWPQLLESYGVRKTLCRDNARAGAKSPVPGAELADFALFTWGPGGDGSAERPYWRWPGAGMRLMSVVRPSETVCLGDGWTTTEYTRGVDPRHGNGANVAFVDGHVRWLTREQVLQVERDASGRHYYLYASADR